MIGNAQYGFVWLAGLLALLLSCKGGPAEKFCLTDVGCPAGYVCKGTIYGPLCLRGQSCIGDRDCPARTYCREGICRRDQASGRFCTVQADCPALEICLSGLCRNATASQRSCTINSQCKPGEVCKDGLCLSLTASGRPCGADGDCPPGEVCHNGACRHGDGPRTCRDLYDCGARQSCLQGSCVDDPTSNLPCQSHVDCAPGQRCLVGICRPGGSSGRNCSRDTDCPAGENCVGTCSRANDRCEGDLPCSCEGDRSCSYDGSATCAGTCQDRSGSHQPCSSDADCAGYSPPGQICDENGLCRLPGGSGRVCRDDLDCAFGEICRSYCPPGVSCTVKICLPADHTGRGCASHADCDPGEMCQQEQGADGGTDGTCIPSDSTLRPCENLLDCPVGEKCLDGYCSGTGDGNPDTYCTQDADCPDGEKCFEDVCIPEAVVINEGCSNNSQCGPGWECANSTCIPAMGSRKPCSSYPASCIAGVLNCFNPPAEPTWCRGRYYWGTNYYYQMCYDTFDWDAVLAGKCNTYYREYTVWKTGRPESCVAAYCQAVAGSGDDCRNASCQWLTEKCIGGVCQRPMGPQNLCNRNSDCDEGQRCLEVPVDGGVEKQCLATPGTRRWCGWNNRCKNKGNWVTYFDFVQNGRFCYRIEKYPQNMGYRLTNGQGWEYTVQFNDVYSMVACPPEPTTATCSVDGDCRDGQYCQLPSSGISCSNNTECESERQRLCTQEGDASACSRREICNEGTCTAAQGKCALRGKVEYYDGDLRRCIHYRFPSHNHARYCGSLGDTCHRRVDGGFVQPDGGLIYQPPDGGLIKLCGIGLNCCRNTYNGWYNYGQGTCQYAFWCP